jgi:hypothetical protein
MRYDNLNSLEYRIRKIVEAWGRSDVRLYGDDRLAMLKAKDAITKFDIAEKEAQEPLPSPFEKPENAL